MIRSACDRCHHKKIRCVLGERSNACVRCLDQELPCVFSPPGRNGRPRRNLTSPRDGAEWTHWPYSDSVPTPPSFTASTPTTDASIPASASFDVLNPRSQMPDVHSFRDLFPTPSDFVDIDTADLFLSDDQIDAVPAFSVDQRAAPPLSLPPSPSSPSENNVSTQPQLQCFPDNSRTPQSLPSGFSLEQIGCLLHSIHRELHHLRANIDIPRNTRSTTTSSQCGHFFGTFAKLVERLHTLLRNFFASTSISSPDGTAAPCDFSTGISFISTIAATLEIYEVVMHCSVTPLPSHNILNSSEPAGSIIPTGEITSPNPTTSDPTTATSSSNPEAEEIQIGCFTPSSRLARWIRMNVLLYEIRTSRKLVDEMRQYFLRLRPTFHPSFTITTNNTAAHTSNSRNSFSMTGVNGTATVTTSSSSLPHRRSSISVLTADSCFTLLRLCEDLLARFNEIERVIDQDIRCNQSDLDNP